MEMPFVLLPENELYRLRDHVFKPRRHMQNKTCSHVPVDLDEPNPSFWRLLAMNYPQQGAVLTRLSVVCGLQSEGYEDT